MSRHRDIPPVPEQFRESAGLERPDGDDLDEDMPDVFGQQPVTPTGSRFRLSPVTPTVQLASLEVPSATLVNPPRVQQYLQTQYQRSPTAGPSRKGGQR